MLLDKIGAPGGKELEECCKLKEGFLESDAKALIWISPQWNYSPIIQGGIVSIPMNGFNVENNCWIQ
jgi:hypothetical protein